MRRDYVSEFTLFIDDYLKAHPEVVKDQQRGWNLFWNPALARLELDEAEAEHRHAEGEALH